MTSASALDSGETKDGHSRYYLIKANDWESFFGKLAFGLGTPQQKPDFNMNDKDQGSSTKETCPDKNGSSSNTCVPNKYMSGKQRKKREQTNSDNSTVNSAREPVKKTANIEIIHLGLDTNHSFQIEQVQYINNMNNISTHYIAEKSTIIDLNEYQPKPCSQNKTHQNPECRTATTNVPYERKGNPVANKHRREMEETVEQNCTVVLHKLQYFPDSLSDVDETDKSVRRSTDEVNADNKPQISHDDHYDRPCNTERLKSGKFVALKNQRKRPFKSMFALKSALMTEKRSSGKIVKRKRGRPKKITNVDCHNGSENSETSWKLFTTDTENEVAPESPLTNLVGESTVKKRGRPRKNKIKERGKPRKSPSPMKSIKIEIESENVTDISEAVDESRSTQLKKKGRPRKYRDTFSDFQNKVHDENENSADVKKSVQTWNINHSATQHRDEKISNGELNDSIERVEENPFAEKKKRGRPRKCRNSANGGVLQIETKCEENFKLNVNYTSEIVPVSAIHNETSNKDEINKSCEKVPEIVFDNKKKRGRPSIKYRDTLSDIQSESYNGDGTEVNVSFQTLNVNPSTTKNFEDANVCKNELNMSVESVENNCVTEKKKRGRPRKPRNIATVDVLQIKTKCEEHSRIDLAHDEKVNEGELNEFCGDVLENDVSEIKKRGRPRKYKDTVSSSHNEILSDEHAKVDESLVPVLLNQSSGSTQISNAESENTFSGEFSMSCKGPDTDSFSEKRKRGRPRKKQNVKASIQTVTHVELNLNVKSGEHKDNFVGIGRNNENETEHDPNTYIPIHSGNNELGEATVENRQRGRPSESENIVTCEQAEIGEHASSEVDGDRNDAEFKPGTFKCEDAAESDKSSATIESSNGFNSTTEYTGTWVNHCSSLEDMELNSKAALDLQDIGTPFTDTKSSVNVLSLPVIKKETEYIEIFDDEEVFCNDGAGDNGICLKRKLSDCDGSEAKSPNTKIKM